MADQNQWAEHLFISYATEDGAFAEWLTLRLTVEGYKVWCDRVKLLGGESYPRDIDNAIKTQTFRMIALISKHSLAKPNPRKERTLGHNISRQRNTDFIIPLLIDDTRPDQLDWMSSDITFISFRDSWAQGLAQLLKKLQTISAPRPLPNGIQLAGCWANQQTGLVESEERLWSNLFEIKKIPPSLYKITFPEDFEPPTASWVHYKQSNRTYWSFETPEWDEVNLSLVVTSVEWNDGSRSTHGIAPINVAALIVKEHLRKLFLSKGSQETHDKGYLYLSHGASPDGWLRFKDYNGRQSRVLASGERTFRASDGSRTRCRYHLVPVFRPMLRKYGPPVLELQLRLHLTDIYGNPLDSSIAQRRRRQIAKRWWNHQWLSRVLAVGAWAFDAQSTYDLAEGTSYQILVSGIPLPATAPIGIDEDVLKLPPDDDEREELSDDGEEEHAEQEDERL